MKTVPTELSLRGDLIDTAQVDVLLKMATNSSLEIRLSAIDTLTHLPLQLEVWSQVVKIIEREISKTTSIPDIVSLIKWGSLVPFGFNFDKAIEQINIESKVREQVLQKIEDENKFYLDQEEIDIEWASSQAPGFTIYSTSEYPSSRKAMYSEIRALIIPVNDFWSMEKIPDDVVDRPVLITLIMELANDVPNVVRVGNELLKYLAKFDNFQPDLIGLFREYLKAAFKYCDGVNRRIGRWFLSERWDPEDHNESWHLWQIAWVVSRGGLSGLIPSLTDYLCSDDETVQLATLAFIADSSDYVLQRRPAVFGGGGIRFRLGPRLPIKFWLGGVRGLMKNEFRKISDDDRNIQLTMESYYRACSMLREIGDQHAVEELEKIINELETINFTTYYPRNTIVGKTYSLIVYAHLPELRKEVNTDAQKFSKEFGGSFPRPRYTGSNAQLKLHAPITIIPECSNVDFDPPELTKRWDGRCTRFLFDFELNPNLADDIVLVRISIQLDGIEIASIKNCAIEVVGSQQYGTDKNPLAQAKQRYQTSILYQNIFISYSRRDSEITRKYKLAQIAFGNNPFIDVDDLRSGENWKAGLAEAIDYADVFQLFWSENSANSIFCRYEWNYALEIRCPNSKCEGFIRPVYWKKPMPDPPPELSDINFKYVPFEDPTESVNK